MREALVGTCFFLPPPRRISLERWLRGREEWHKLASADAVCVSCGNSGATWLRVLLCRYFQIRYGLKTFAIIDYDNLHMIDDIIPKILFTHDNYLADYTGNRNSKIDYMKHRLQAIAPQKPQNRGPSIAAATSARRVRGQRSPRQLPGGRSSLPAPISLIFVILHFSSDIVRM